MMKGMDPPDGPMFGQNRKARSFGPGGRQQGPAGPIGEGFDPMAGNPHDRPVMVDQAGLPRPAWGGSLDLNRAMKLPPLEV